MEFHTIRLKFDGFCAEFVWSSMESVQNSVAFVWNFMEFVISCEATNLKKSAQFTTSSAGILVQPLKSFHSIIGFN